MKKTKAANVIVLAVLAVWVVSAAGCCPFSGKSTKCAMPVEAVEASAVAPEMAPAVKPAKVIVNGGLLRQVNVFNFTHCSGGDGDLFFRHLAVIQQSSLDDFCRNIITFLPVWLGLD